MTRMTRSPARLLVMAAAITAGVALADSYNLDWHTIDGGGDMLCTGGVFELSGTIGQPDASTAVLTGGDFELTGGFWRRASWHAPDQFATTPSDQNSPDQDYEQVDMQPPPLP